MHLVYCRYVKLWRWGPRSTLISLSHRPLSGPNSVAFGGKKMLGALLLFYHFADTFVQRVHLLQGRSPWSNLRLSVLPKGTMIIVHKLLLVGFKPTTFYLLAYNRSATSRLVSLPTKLLKMWRFNQFTNWWRGLHIVLVLVSIFCLFFYDMWYKHLTESKHLIFLNFSGHNSLHVV